YWSTLSVRSLPMLEARAEQIRTALRSPQLETGPIVTSAHGNSVRATARIVREMTIQLAGDPGLRQASAGRGPARWQPTPWGGLSPLGVLRDPGLIWRPSLLRLPARPAEEALRAVANRRVGILHACLAKRVEYDEALAWPAPLEQPARVLPAIRTPVPS
ncbi:transposase IS111A/IS1328/IS1533, partial [mine drainage metagenome]